VCSRPASGTWLLDLSVIFAVHKELRDLQQARALKIACKVPPGLAPDWTGTELAPMHQRGWELSSSALGWKSHNQITAWAGPGPKRECFVGMLIRGQSCLRNF